MVRQLPRCQFERMVSGRIHSQFCGRNLLVHMVSKLTSFTLYYNFVYLIKRACFYLNNLFDSGLDITTRWRKASWRWDLKLTDQSVGFTLLFLLNELRIIKEQSKILISLEIFQILDTEITCWQLLSKEIEEMPNIIRTNQNRTNQNRTIQIWTIQIRTNSKFQNLCPLPTLWPIRTLKRRNSNFKFQNSNIYSVSKFKFK